MKKLVLVLWVVIFSAMAYAQGGKEYTLNVDAFYDNDTEIWRDANKKPITGVLKGYYESGEIFEDAPIKNGKPEGIVKEYYKSGELLDESTFKNGKLEGLEKHYYESGKVMNEIPYKNGKIEGVNKFYHESGKIAILRNFKDNKWEGLEINFSENGEIFATTINENGVRKRTFIRPFPNIQFQVE
jgi:antitoxin component YwqK of YwqJK toxin-antitoxin module